MMKEEVKEIVKTALGVIIIYIMAVCLSLFLCDRLSELESNEDLFIENEKVVLRLR